MARKKFSLDDLDPQTVHLLCSECLEYTRIPCEGEFQCESCGSEYSRARVVVEGLDIVLNS